MGGGGAKEQEQNLLTCRLLLLGWAQPPTYLMKKEVLAEEPVLQGPPRLHILDVLSGRTEEGPPRTVSATATAATAASACGKEGL